MPRFETDHQPVHLTASSSISSTNVNKPPPTASQPPNSSAPPTQVSHLSLTLRAQLHPTLSPKSSPTSSRPSPISLPYLRKSQSCISCSSSCAGRSHLHKKTTTAYPTGRLRGRRSCSRATRRGLTTYLSRR